MPNYGIHWVLWLPERSNCICIVFVLYLYCIHQQSFLPSTAYQSVSPVPLIPRPLLLFLSSLIRLVLLGSPTTICHFYFYFARGLLKVQRRHNVYLSCRSESSNISLVVFRPDPCFRIWITVLALKFVCT